MKFLAALLLSLSFLPALAQPSHYAVHKLHLPKEIEYYDNQFSGLSISGNKLFIMSESRLQDRAEGKLYTVSLADLDHQLRDSTYALPFQKLPLTNLPALRAKINRAGQSYEGLEALLIDQQTVYFSVETATPATNCYLLKGTLAPTAVVLDTTFLVTMPKPLAADGAHIYNAGFEALAETDKRLFAFFEFNYFPGSNYAYELDKQPLTSASTPRKRAFDKLPFRITDMAATGKNHFTGINYFFKGEGGDAVYRTPASDASTKLIAADGGFQNYCRLVTIELKDNTFSWQPLWEFPAQYRGYNWEGIAAYKRGYFLINDKYTPSKPYQTTLLYLQPLGK